jgi:hypothetical protein
MPRGTFRILSSGLEPQGRLDRQTVQGAAIVRHRRQHRPISEPDALPTHPQQRYHSVLPRFVNSVRHRPPGAY